jgi:hypothetical protein
MEKLTDQAVEILANGREGNVQIMAKELLELRHAMRAVTGKLVEMVQKIDSTGSVAKA